MIKYKDSTVVRITIFSEQLINKLVMDYISNIKVCSLSPGPITPFEFAFLHAKPRAGVQ